ncbi:tandem-95 repeat protein, partial [Mycolicibacterium sp. BiH015]|uniref:tandem-95 repeat protein n=1 Tax=Mycolicibacterium sp. BiH015 TaxID=3018808 RepID=UPI0022E60BA7
MTGYVKNSALEGRREAQGNRAGTDANVDSVGISRCARHIGRVGALAVALGIGLAASSGLVPAIAHAEDESTSADDTSSADAAEQEGNSFGTEGETTSERAPDESDAAASPSESDRDDEAPSEPTGADTSGMEMEAVEGPPPLSETDQLPAPSSVENEKAPASATDSRHASKKSSSAEARYWSATQESVARSATTEFEDEAAGIHPTESASIAASIEATRGTAPLRPSSADLMSDVAPAPPAGVRIPTSNPGLVDAVRLVARVLLAPFAGGDTRPTESPMLILALAWARREAHRNISELGSSRIQSAALAQADNSAAGSAPPAARDDAFNTAEDIALTDNVLTNDIAENPDGTGEPLTVVTTGPIRTAAGGSVNLTADGSFTYVPRANHNGTDSFQYTVTDGTSTATGQVSLSVIPVNDVPVAVNDNKVLTEDFTRTFTAADLLWNDTDPDKATGDTLSFHSVTGATHGTVILNTDGTITFTPTANYSGPASFTYKVKDTTGAISTNTATVSLTINPVNDVPIAVNDNKVLTEDFTRTFTAADLLWND